MEGSTSAKDSARDEQGLAGIRGFSLASSSSPAMGESGVDRGCSRFDWMEKLGVPGMLAFSMDGLGLPSRIEEASFTGSTTEPPVTLSRSLENGEFDVDI
mmetsp:Transcript_68358/g.103091  ORF Transcript_68358/g.103091 Transcript_68358/m.103091 type:complete len:100 (+) Transcript_68358:1987-2286(+)